MYNDSLELSLILESKKIIRVDIVYETSDFDCQSSTLKNAAFGLFAIGDEASFDISSTTTIGDNDNVNVKVSVNFNFVSETKASGQVKYSENYSVIKTSDIEINWKQKIPETGFIRDGTWSSVITDPIIVYFSFDILSGATGAINFLYIDSQNFGLGYTYGNSTLSIGDNLDFSITTSIDVSIEFSSYMEGSGTILLDLVGGDENVPVDCNWSPQLPSDKKKSSSIEKEQTQLINKYNKSKSSYCLSPLK